jgi:glutathione S-transferase
MTSSTQISNFDLYYWPGLQGRGEFIRLALEAAGVAYRDVARLPEAEGGGAKAVVGMMRSPGSWMVPLAPPILKTGDLVLAQVANILFFLGPKLDLCSEREDQRWYTNQLQLTITDLVAEIHDTHHPISTSMYYEQQREEAIKKAQAFVAQRMPKFLNYFENIIQKSTAGYLIGEHLSYVDTSMFQVLEGLSYAFPTAFAEYSGSIPGLLALRDRIRKHPGIANYLSSDRRLPFNEHGIFRRYPELNVPLHPNKDAS